jgi:iron complex outermembrane receptor protein
VNKQLSNELSVYGQYAEGFQIPDLKTFYINNPSLNSSAPQKSTNYQLGVVGKSDKMTWDLDIYQINFTNKLVSNGLTGANAAFINIGGATYKGVEGQMAYAVDNNFSVFANGSINKALANDTGKQISGAPEMTAAVGALFAQGPWASSLILKRTGAVYQKDYTNQAYYDFYKTAAYDNLDVGVSYTMKNVAQFKTVKVQMNVFNLANSQKATAITAASSSVTGNAYDTYIYQAPRSAQISVKADF